MHGMGILGFPRRISDYADQLTGVSAASSAAVQQVREGKGPLRTGKATTREHIYVSREDTRPRSGREAQPRRGYAAPRSGALSAPTGAQPCCARGSTRYIWLCLSLYPLLHGPFPAAVLMLMLLL